MKAILAFIKKNIIVCICGILAVSVSLTGAYSFSRFVSTDSANKQASNGGFFYSASVDGVSALSFTNTAFWGGTNDDVAMNALRTLDFSVNNYEIVDGEKKVSDVRLGYSLVFSAPKNFMEKLAIQLFDKGGAPLLPQLVLSHIQETPDGGSFNTHHLQDYHGEPTEDLEFDVEITNGVYTARSGDIVITLTPTVRTFDALLNFRLWDVSEITSEESPTADMEGGKLLSPISINFQNEVQCVDISIRLPSFVLPAGTEETHNYMMCLAPTHTINDNHLGGMIADVSGNPISSIFSGQPIKLVSNHETVTDTYTDGTVDSWKQTVIGSAKVFHEGEVITEDPVINELKIENYDKQVTETVSAPTVTTVSDTSKSNNPRGGTLVSTTGSGSNTRRIYELDVEKIEEITTVKTTTTVETYTSTDRIHSLTERVTTLDISDDGKTITQTIEWITENSDKTDTVTVTTVNRIITVTREKTYGVRTYVTNRNGSYQPSHASNKVEWNTVETLEGYPVETPHHEIPVTRSVNGTPEVTTVILRADRVIVRTSETVQIVPSRVSRTVENTEYLYDEENQFRLFEQSGIQKYYISQCYSKNYPMRVKVLFEQIQ